MSNALLTSEKAKLVTYIMKNNRLVEQLAKKLLVFILLHFKNKSSLTAQQDIIFIIYIIFINFSSKYFLGVTIMV